MGFLDKLRGIPDEVAPPAGVPAPHVSAVHNRRDFDLGSLPRPDAHVKAAVEAKQLIVAIKAYVQQANVGLAEAKHVIDAMARGDRLIAGRASEAVAAPETAAAVGASADEEIVSLIRAGRKIEAIKAHRLAYGTSLKESKDAIDARWDDITRG